MLSSWEEIVLVAYLNLGSDFLVNIKDIIGIFDLDVTKSNDRTGTFLKNAEDTGNVITIDNDLPKSFIVANVYDDVRVYLSSLSCASLSKRIEKNNIERGYLNG